jgi:hypothetical protein
MPLFKVTLTKTITETHVIDAPSRKMAIIQMQAPLHVGLVDILEDACTTEVEAHPYPGPDEKMAEILERHDVQMCEITGCDDCKIYFSLLQEQMSEEADVG